eukprot:INCI1550.1.p1 GENE.INCI1550.1~~INCI1550.1.p1  ORF type:complete len:297 (-),score=55.67 INCI1550.1:1250-2140(-)
MPSKSEGSSLKAQEKPKRRRGPAEHRAAYFYLNKAGLVLQLPRPVICTACVYFHKYVASGSLAADTGRFDDELRFLAVTCLFLAAKAEESPRDIRSILNVHQYLKPGREAAGDPPFFPQLNSAYWDAKERIVALEQDILRVLAFDVEVAHPFKHLTLLAHALACTRDVVLIAISVVCDSYSDPSVCLGHTPHDVAVAALYVAKRVRPALLMQQQQQHRETGESSTPTTLDADTKRMDTSMEQGWWETMGTSTATVNELGAKLALASQLLGTSSLSTASPPAPMAARTRLRVQTSRR